jgi:hypothetical protein
MILTALFCFAVLADSEETDNQESDSQVKVIESSDYLEEVLPKIVQVAKELKEKEFYRSVPPVPTYTDRDQCRTTLDDLLRFIRNTAHDLVFSPMDPSIEINWKRKDRAELYLALLKVAREALGSDFDRASYFTASTRRRGRMNLLPVRDASDDTGQGFVSGMWEGDIIHPKTRDNYRMALWENSKIILNNQIDREWIDLLDRVSQRTKAYLVWAYRQEPRADQELIDLLEKYEYPDEERGKLLEAVNMSDAEYQKWRQGGRTVESVEAVHKLQPGEKLINGGTTVSSTTETIITVPKIVAVEPYVPQEKPSSNRWVIVLVNVVLFALLLWWLLRKDTQK